jgi:hypothetical protein
MNTASLPRAIAVSRPLAVRWWEVLQAAWRARADRRRDALEIARVAELSDHVLDDIAAPEWLRIEAAARREVEKLREAEIRLGLGGRLFDR